MLGVWKKSLIKVIQIKATESLFFCSASDLVFRVVRDEFQKFWHGHILMFNTVNETVKFNHYSPRAIPARVWNSLETVAHKHLYLNAECVLCTFNESSFQTAPQGIKPYSRRSIVGQIIVLYLYLVTCDSFCLFGKRRALAETFWSYSLLSHGLFTLRTNDQARDHCFITDDRVFERLIIFITHV